MPEASGLQAVLAAWPPHARAGAGQIAWAALLLPTGTPPPPAAGAMVVAACGGGFLATDRIEMQAWAIAGEAMRWQARLRRVPQFDLEPAPRELVLLLEGTAGAAVRRHVVELDLGTARHTVTVELQR